MRFGERRVAGLGSGEQIGRALFTVFRRHRSVLSGVVDVPEVDGILSGAELVRFEDLLEAVHDVADDCGFREIAA